jgi:hypothetical protein
MIGSCPKTDVRRIHSIISVTDGNMRVSDMPAALLFPEVAL